jgi:hypothetical protein
MAHYGHAKVAMKLFGKPNSVLLSMARVHFDAIERSDFYLQPSPSQDDFALRMDAFEESCQEVMALRTALKTAMARRKTERKKLEQAMNRRGNYVQAMSYGNAARIISAAMRVQRHRTKVGPLPSPKEVQVTPGKSENEVVLTWGKVKHAHHYYLQHGPEGGPMEDMVLSGRRKRTLKLPRLNGVPHVFRIAAIGTPGLGDYSPWVKLNPW